MRSRRFFRFMLLAAVATGAFALPAGAQQAGGQMPMPQLQASDLRQYPSFISITGKTGGPSPAEFALRCGYSATAGGQISMDPSLNDFSMIEVKTNAYSRFQNIDGRPVVTGPDPSGNPNRRVIEVVEPDGTTKAKNCALDSSTDTVSQCTPAQAAMTAEQVQSQLAAIDQQCEAFSKKTQIDPGTFSEAKTEAYKKHLESKLAALENGQ